MSLNLSRIAAGAALAASTLTLACLPAFAADKVKVGFVSTLSGPSSALGVDIRDGFLLAVKLNGGKLGGLPAEVLVGDDQFKPDVAKQLFEKNVKRDKVDFMTGIVFSNIMLAALPEALDNKTIYISPNAAPSSIAGKDCNPLFFAVVAGRTTRTTRRPASSPTQRGLKSVYLVAPELPGRQGFARRLQAHLQGPGRRRDLHQARPARLRRRARRDPRRQAGGASTSSCPAAWASTSSSSSSAPGLARTSSCVLPGFSADQDVINPVGERDGRPVQHRALVARLRQRGEPEVRGRVREGIQAHADAVRVAGLRRGAADRRRGARRQGQARGPATRCARRCKAAHFDSVRGPFKFNTNQYPIQNYYLRTVGTDGKGGLINKSFSDADPQGPRRRLRAGLQDEVSAASRAARACPRS